jgi:hypothetical protein
MKVTVTDFGDWIRTRWEPNDEQTPNAADGKSGGNAAPESNGGDWPVLDAVANHGLAGEFVASVAPHTEADNVALHLTFMTSFGNAVGRKPITS